MLAPQSNQRTEAAYVPVMTGYFPAMDFSVRHIPDIIRSY